MTVARPAVQIGDIRPYGLDRRSTHCCRLAESGRTELIRLRYYLAMNYPTKIRRAIAADADCLTALIRASAAYVGRYAQLLAAYKVTPAQIAKDEVFVVEYENGISGFYSLVTVPVAELDLLFVSDAAQGKSLGKLLFQHMCARARINGATTVLIVSHPPSVGFYQRVGAQIAGIKPSSASVPWDRPVLHMCL
jgi:N-acetylglutamate synthase-like GNAT family acetyltransferase